MEKTDVAKDITRRWRLQGVVHVSGSIHSKDRWDVVGGLKGSMGLWFGDWSCFDIFCGPMASRVGLKTKENLEVPPKNTSPGNRHWRSWTFPFSKYVWKTLHRKRGKKTRKPVVPPVSPVFSRKMLSFQSFFRYTFSGHLFPSRQLEDLDGLGLWKYLGTSVCFFKVLDDEARSGDVLGQLPGPQRKEMRKSGKHEICCILLFSIPYFF